MRPATSILTRTALGLLLALLAPARFMAQHETAADLLDGERAFTDSCANCHGPDGDQSSTGIDLGRGRFRRPMTDDDLVRIIRTGIPEHADAGDPDERGAGAEDRRLSAARAAATVRAASLRGDAARGKTLFDAQGRRARRATASTAAGSRVGPDLSSVGATRSAAELQRALIDPNADVQAHEPLLSRHAAGRHGRSTGRLLGHDTFTVQLLDTKEQLRSFSKARPARARLHRRRRCRRFAPRLTPQEIADVVSYLSSSDEAGR